MNILHITSTGPHDFELCLRVMGSFTPGQTQDSSVLRTAVRIKNTLAVLELRQTVGKPSTLEIRTDLQNNETEIKWIAGWITFAELDLAPFYKLASSHPVLGPITQALHGLKPMRPASLFEMLVIAITEQQISLAAAHHIRMRIIERFGDQVDGLWVFPTPERLSNSSIKELMACGLSQRKAEYVKGLAHKIDEGMLDLEQLVTMPDKEVRELLLKERGLGPWSVDYFLVRGLSRPDCVPESDLGIRSVVGRYLGAGRRLSPQGVLRKLSPFKPYRGLAAFYLLAYDRFIKKVEKQVNPGPV
jgi:DNA-3-methyladenine glycosylase II